nr:hypothetical protein Iba_chr11eCG4420 [Ipomoea batatas]
MVFAISPENELPAKSSKEIWGNPQKPLIRNGSGQLVHGHVIRLNAAIFDHPVAGSSPVNELLKALINSVRQIGTWLVNLFEATSKSEEFGEETLYELNCFRL